MKLGWGEEGHRQTRLLTSLFKFRPLEFGSRPMAQSRQSTSAIVVKVGSLPGIEVTMQSSRPEEVFLTSLTYQQIQVINWRCEEWEGKQINRKLEFLTFKNSPLNPANESGFSVCAQSCPTLWDPMDCSSLGSSVCGIFQVRILGWVAISFSRGSSWARDRTRIFCLAGRLFFFFNFFYL